LALNPNFSPNPSLSAPVKSEFKPELIMTIVPSPEIPQYPQYSQQVNGGQTSTMHTPIFVLVPCQYGGKCTLIKDSKHTSEYRHICPYDGKCAQMNDEQHLTRYSHMCRHEDCPDSANAQHAQQYLHKCRKKGECTNKHVHHVKLYFHPPPSKLAGVSSKSSSSSLWSGGDGPNGEQLSFSKIVSGAFNLLKGPFVGNSSASSPSVTSAPLNSSSGGVNLHGSSPVHWDGAQVGNWISLMSLSEEERSSLQRACRKHYISGEVLMTLSEEDIKKIGIDQLGTRRNFLDAIRRLGGGGGGGAPL
jgi:hypothetical protein